MGDLQESYRILGILPGATFDDAKAAWRLRAQEFHPDRFQDEPPEVQDAAERQFKALSEAWRVVREHLGDGRADGPTFGPSGYPPPNSVWNDRAATPTRDRRSILSNRAMAIVGVAMLFIAAFVGYRISQSNGPEPYPDEVQSAFVSECQNRGLDYSRCHCIIKGVMDVVPYDEYTQLNEKIATTGTTPPKVVDAIRSC